MSGMKKPQTAAATLTSASRRLRGRKTERTKGEEQQGVPPFRSLVRPIPYPLESLQGYVARFCTLNGFDHIRWLLPFARSEAGLDASQGRRGAISPEPRGPLCGMAGLGSGDALGIGLRYWNTRFLRYCPLCLAEASYHRAVWQLVFGVACHIHKVWLRDECCVCNRKTRLTDLPLGVCPCGALLNSAATEPCTSDVAIYARVLSAALHRDKESIDTTVTPVQGLDIDQLLRATWFLGAYSTCNTAKAQKIAGVMQLDRSISLVEAVAKVLLDWPQGFNALLDKLTASEKLQPNGNRLAARFGRFYFSLYRSFPEASCSFLREGFEAYVTSQWTGQLARRNRRLSSKSRESYEWVSIKEAAKVLKVRVELARNLVENGVLVGSFFVTATGRRMGTVLKSSLLAERDRRAGLATLDEARRVLGVSKKRMYKMVADGTLQAVQGPMINGAAVWQFDKASLSVIKDALVLADSTSP
ncbi:TniQ protein [Cupriavidus metallidurans]